MGRAFKPEDLLGCLEAAGKFVSFRERQVIYSAGEKSDAIFLIRSGSIKMVVVSAEGNEAITAVLNTGELFGTEALSVPVVLRAAHAVALTNLRLVKLAPDLLIKVILSDPAICALFISDLSTRIMRSQDDLASSLLYNSEQRLARALLSMAEVARTHKPPWIPELSQLDLARMIGTTRQRVNSLMKRFRTQGFIEDPCGKHLHDSVQPVAPPDLMTRTKR